MAWRASRNPPDSNQPDPNQQNNPSGPPPSLQQHMGWSGVGSATGLSAANAIAAAETAEQSAQSATAASAIRMIDKLATSTMPPPRGGGTTPNSHQRQFYTSSAPHRPPIIELSPLQLLNSINLAPNPQNLLRLETLIRLLDEEIRTLQVVVSSRGRADGRQQDTRYISTLLELHKVFTDRGRRTSSSSPRRGAAGAGEMEGDGTPSRRLHSWWANSLSKLQRQQTALLLLQLYTETLRQLYQYGTAMGERTPSQRRLEFETELARVVGHLRVLVPLL